MAQFSFDIVSDYDKSEINNVFDQAKREIENRYDFKGTPAGLEWLDANKAGVKIIGNSTHQVDAILEIIRKKLASRQQSQKILDTSREITATNLKAIKEVPFISGLDQDKAKRITKLIRDKFPKLKTQIQGDVIRVTSSNKNELQATIQLIQTNDFDFPVNFTNFR